MRKRHRRRVEKSKKGEEEKKHEERNPPAAPFRIYFPFFFEPQRKQATAHRHIHINMSRIHTHRSGGEGERKRNAEGKHNGLPTTASQSLLFLSPRQMRVNFTAFSNLCGYKHPNLPCFISSIDIFVASYFSASSGFASLLHIAQSV